MAIIKCPECSKEISDKAVSCPNCGMPLDKVSIKLNTIKSNLKYPVLPNDLSIGSQLVNWTSDAAIHGYYENSGNNDDFIMTGNLHILLHENGLRIAGGLYLSLLDINYLQIISVEEMIGSEIRKDKTVVGRAVVGTIILGPLGAIIGGMFGVGNKYEKSNVLTIAFWDTKTKEPKTFSLLTDTSSQRFINRLIKERHKLLKLYPIDDIMPPTPQEKLITQSLKNRSQETHLFTNNSDEELLRKVRERSCFIATVVYEDINCKELQKLRNWRDASLRKNVFGRMFIKVYYAVGERLSQIIKPHLFARRLIKIVLDAIVKKV